ncbi:MAG: tryptophan--tRNA ligase [Cyanobacteria bacterium HKST-UBA06]|nr:tryptophan--tRNA ligase [Cyanobacteria bacterium HKST-UBA06]
MTEPTAQSADTQPKRVMSGMRATGQLHLGHWVGVLKNWVALQSQYNCYFMVADWHSLTTHYTDPGNIRQHCLEMVLDWLSAGINPEHAHLYKQSEIPEIAELHLLLSMMTPQKWLDTAPTLKDMISNLGIEATHGLLGYPVLQTADILIVKGELVPVGKDQLAHLELSRDIVTRFNHVTQSEFFPSPQALLTEAPALPGLDGRKMSKSLNNSILLCDTDSQTTKKLKQAITDPARIKREDPGTPENCEVVYKYYQVFAPPEEQQLAAEECRSAVRGCADCKLRLADMINAQLAPLREKRTVLAQDTGAVKNLLNNNVERTRHEAIKTIRKVRKLLKLGS